MTYSLRLLGFILLTLQRMGLLYFQAEYAKNMVCMLNIFTLHLLVHERRASESIHTVRVGEFRGVESRRER